ncbi:MAG: hypothetical protein Q9183_002664 [Haloplaca sp. 2 TL-2023]
MSQPKYWCKHCKTFVRDTKLEKTNHEATAKHQGNIKRFLRDLHRDHEREEREKDKAKNEVERLNGVVSGTGAAAKTGPWNNHNRTAISSASGPREATPAERRAQMMKLAEMGVAVPEDFRRETAMAGDWQTLSERPVWSRAKKEEDHDDFKGFKPDSTLNVGIRKRKIEGEEEAEEIGPTVIRKGWGSTVKRYPGCNADSKDDLDVLLDSAVRSERVENGAHGGPAHESKNQQESPSTTHKSAPTVPALKKEDSEAIDLNNLQTPQARLPGRIKEEDSDTQAPVVFKKRKTKSTQPS